MGGWPVFIDGRPTPPHFEPSRLRRWLGDFTWQEFVVPDDMDETDTQRIRAAFPESRVICLRDWIADFQSQHPEVKDRTGAGPRSWEQIDEDRDDALADPR